jgi:hypothetical protein
MWLPQEHRVTAAFSLPGGPRGRGLRRIGQGDGREGAGAGDSAQRARHAAGEAI